MSKLFALVPAAGSGARMGAALPKQYLPLAGRPLLYHTLRQLCACADIERVFVVLAAGDTFFAQQDWRPFADRIEPLFCGGAARAASVFNGLLAVRDLLAADDWVLVHDAVRPCLPVLPRGGGTSQCGQTVGAALVIDNSKHLKKVVSVDPAAATDESSAIERLGLRPRLVNGDTRNLKVTYPHDLELAALILNSMEKP